MESHNGGQRAKCTDDSTKSKVNDHKPIFKITGPSKSEVVAKGNSDSPTINKETTNQADDLSPYRAVKAIVYKVVRVYESRPPKTMKYLGIACILLLLVAIVSVTLSQETASDATQSKYGLAFPLGAAKEKLIAVESLKVANESLPDNEESVVPVTPTTATTAVTDEPAKIVEEIVIENDGNDDKKPNESEEKVDLNERPAMVIESDEEEEKSDEESGPNPRIVFIERLMGLHLSAPANKPDTAASEQSESNDQPMNANRKDKVNAKWASRTRKFTIPIPNQNEGEQLNFVPQPPQPQENPILRYAAAAMMSKILAAAARAQMEAQRRDAMLSRSNQREEEHEPNQLPFMFLNRQQELHRPMPSQMYGRPISRPPMLRQIVSYPNRMQQIPQQRNFIVPMQQRQSVHQMIQRRIAQQSQPMVVMLAIPLRTAESQQQQQQHYIQQPHYVQHQQMYPSVERRQTPIVYHQQIAAPQMVHAPQYIQRRSYGYYPQTQRFIQQRQLVIRPVIEVPVPVEAPVHYHPVPVQVQHRMVAVQPQMMQHVQPSDHQSSSSEPGHMIVVYDANNDDNGDLESSPSEEQEDAYHRAEKLPFMYRHLPPNPSPMKAKLLREIINAKQAAQSGIRYIPVSMATREEQPNTPINHFIAPKLFTMSKQEAQQKPTFVVIDGQEDQ